MPPIDIHTHVVPASFPARMGGASDLAWPSMDHDGCSHARLVIAGKVFRTLDEPAWNPRRRVEHMAAMGVERQVLSPMPELLSYWLPAGDAARLLRHVNEEIAGMVAVDPRRFAGLGAVPLQDVDAAIEELDFVVRRVGLAGVEIGTNVNGVPIGAARFEPFFARAEELGAAVFVHALRAAGTERLVGPALLENIVAFPCEVSFAIASMITGGTLARHPGLRIAFSHGGGAFALVLARMEHTWPVIAGALDPSVTESPRTYARRAYYDTAVFDARVLGFLAETFGEDRLLVGTDYPFAAHERDPLALLRKAGLGEGAEAAITHDNALRFLGLEEKGERSCRASRN